MTQKDHDLLIEIKTKVDGIEKWIKGVHCDLKDHKEKDHRLMWTFIIGLPTLFGIIITIVLSLK